MGIHGCWPFPLAFDGVSDCEWWLGWLGLGVLLVALLSYLRCRRRLRKKILLAGGEHGTIAVSSGALQEIIRSICYGMDGAMKSSTRVRLRKGNLHISIRMRAPVGGNVCAIAKAVQERTAEYMRGQFGLGISCTIDVLIGGFRGGVRGCGQDVYGERAGPKVDLEK
jgi:hypothetical protein